LTFWVQSTKPSWYLYLPHQTHLKLKNQLFRNMTLELIVLDHLIPKCMDARDFLHFLFHKKCPCQFKTCSIVFMFYCFQRYMVTGDLCHFSFPKNVPRSGMSATESSLSPDPKIYDCWIWSYNLMLNSVKKIRALRDKKINILTLVLSENKFLNETKNLNPPPLS
jgi:hypothetical protein